MKKQFFSLLLVLVLILSLTACGSEAPAETTAAAQSQETASQPQPETVPTEVASSDPELITKVQDMITQFCADELYLSAARDYESAMEITARSPYLYSAMEHQIDDPQGISTHVLLVDMLADVSAHGGIIFDHVQLLLDLDTGECFSSLSPEFQSWAGDCETKEGLRFALLNAYYGFQPGGIYFTQLEHYTALSQEEIDSVNAALDLAHTEQPWEVEAEPLTTTDEERVQLVTDAARQFCQEQGSILLQNYASATGSEADTFTVSHAMEYKIGSWDGYPVHLILMALKGNVGYGDGLNDRILVMQDLETGAIYDESMIPGDFYDHYDGICAGEEDLPWAILSIYAGYLYNPGEQVYYETEVYSSLTQPQLDSVNAALN